MGWSCSMYGGQERYIQGLADLGKRQLGRPRRKWADNIKLDLQVVEWGHGLD